MTGMIGVKTRKIIAIGVTQVTVIMKKRKPPSKTTHKILVYKSQFPNKKTKIKKAHSYHQLMDIENIQLIFLKSKTKPKRLRIWWKKSNLRMINQRLQSIITIRPILILLLKTTHRIILLILKPVTVSFLCLKTKINKINDLFADENI